MATGNVGTLKVFLGGDVSGLDKSLMGALRNITSFANAAGVQLDAVAQAMNIKAQIDVADKLNKMSQSSGMAVEDLSKLKYAAELSDVEIDALAKSVGKLSKAMVSAAGDGAGPAAEAFKAMGVSVRQQDGTLKSSSQMLADIADRFASYKDGAEKTALAIAIFGKAGASMIPLLNQGSAGLKEAGEEAAKFGLVLSKDVTASAERFNDNLKRMDAIKKGLYTTIASELLPTLETLSEKFLEAKKNSDFTTQAAGFVKIALGVLGDEAANLVVKLQNVGKEFGALKELFTSIGDWRQMVSAWDNWNRVQEEIEVNLAKVRVGVADVFTGASGFEARFGAIWDGQLAGVMALNKEVVKLGDSFLRNAPIIGGADAQALQNFLDNQQKKIAAQNAEAETVGKAAGEQARLRIEYEAQAIALAKNIPLTDALRAKIAAAGEDAALSANKMQAAQISQMALSPAEKYAQDLANLQTVYDTTLMTAETFAARQKQLSEGVSATWNQAGAQMAGGFAQLANEFGKSSREMAVAGKAFGIIEATINTYTAFTKALTAAPPPFNYVLAAGTLAAGMAKVIAISSMSIPAAAMGGAFKVPGGMGGGDKMFTPMMLEPGELVEVSSNRAGGYKSGGRGDAGAGRTLVMNGFMWSRDQMETLFAFINQGLSDDHKLNVKFAS